MSALCSSLSRHYEIQPYRVGVVAGPRGTLDQFPTLDIGFRLLLTAFQELEEQIVSAMY